MLYHQKPEEKIMLKDEEAPFEDVKTPYKEKKVGKKVKIFALVLCAALAFCEFFGLGYLVGRASKRTYLPMASQAKKKLLLISIDGFRMDYIMRGKTPNLVALASSGYLSRLVPQFPSYTFPNHFSIVTGLYPESHGIVSNAFYDPASQLSFVFTNSTSTMHASFWNADPIWNTNEEQGGKSAVLHYPGSDVAIHGKRPSLYEPFTDQITSKARVSTMLKWLDASDSVNLGVLYFDELDHAGHIFGPDSDEVNQALKSIDNAIGDLVTSLKRRGTYDQYNLVIVSDHGMVKAARDKKIYLDKYIPNFTEMCIWSDYGPVASFTPKPEYKYRLGVLIKRAIRKYSLPVRMFTKHTMPSAYHYTKNDRIAPYVLEAKKGWSIDASVSDFSPKGIHGYGRSVREMDGIFLANGPAFRTNPVPRYPLFSNLDVYPLMCDLLGIEPKANNGTRKLSAAALVASEQLN